MKSNLFLSWPILFLLIAIFFMFFAWRQSSSMEQIYKEQMGFELQARGHLLSAVAIWFGEREEWKELREFFVSQGNAIRARLTLIDSEGNVIADTLEMQLENHLDRPEVIAALHHPGEDRKYFRYIRFSNTCQEKLYYCANPIRINGKRYVLRVAISIHEMDIVMVQARQDIVWSVVVTLFLSAAVSYFLFQTVSRPALALCEASAKVAAGDFDTVLPVPERGVIRELGDSVSRMAEELKCRIGQILRDKSERDVIFGALAEGVFVIDFDRNVIDVNNAALKMFEFKEAPKALPGEEDEIEEYISELKSGKAVAEREVTISPPSGEKQLRMRGSVVTWGEGNISGIMLVFYDLTQLRKLENFRRDFIANVSHEIKTPLTVIRGAIETLQDGAINEPEAAARFMQIIEMHSERLNSLVLDILSLSRLECRDAKEYFVLLPGELRHALDVAIHYTQPRADKAGIRIVPQLESDPHVLLDEQLIEQAVINLIDNAIRHSGESNEILVRLFTEGEEAVIEVIDHGCGIDFELTERIFERFYRIDKARSRKAGGTGLGLAIVKHTMQIHNGSAEVESASGKGAVFRLRIPLYKGDADS